MTAIELHRVMYVPARSIGVEGPEQNALTAHVPLFGAVY